jgi:DNA-binding MarR family transcriptional regulator
VDEADRRVLAFIAAHRFVLPAQVAKLLGTEPAAVWELLAGLEAGGLVRSERLMAGRAASVRITGAGLGAIGSRLPVPGFRLDGYRHAVGVVWLWLEARSGAFGEIERGLSVREMVGLDAAATAAGSGVGSGFARRVAGGPEGQRPAVQYPDLGVVAGGRRASVYLELRRRGQRAFELLFADHAADPELAGVLVLAEDPRVRADVVAAAAAVGISKFVQVEDVDGVGE